jgi:addiction module RelE/StbE family toxin
MVLLFSYSSRYKRMFRKLPNHLKDRVEERVTLALTNEFDPVLDNHSLRGKWIGCRSIDITGDYRVIFQRLSDTFHALAVGTHPELYGN